MLIVSFCDIVTITTAAMFFALLITVQEAVKIPVYQPPPMAHVAKTPDGREKQPVFFECRDDQVFYINKVELDEKVEHMLSVLSPNMRSGDPTTFVKAISGNEVGNKYYKVIPSYLLAMMMAIEPKPGVLGDDSVSIHEPNSDFQKYLRSCNRDAQYIVFLVRGKSFEIFKKARRAVDTLGFDIGFEMLEENEPIKFGTGGSAVNAL